MPGEAELARSRVARSDGTFTIWEGAKVVSPPPDGNRGSPPAILSTNPRRRPGTTGATFNQIYDTIVGAQPIQVTDRSVRVTTVMNCKSNDMRTRRAPLHRAFCIPICANRT